VGAGRLAEPDDIVAAVEAVLGSAAASAPTADLAGVRTIVTAGGTREPIDPVRFIGNRSTGRMGVAVAEAALARGARVTLIHGMTSVPLPDAATLVDAPTTAAMREAVLAGLSTADALVMAAAVADFRPTHVVDSKLGRGDGLTLELEPTEDILAEASALAHAREDSGQPRPVLVGFAAETGSLERAPEKAARKRVDLLVANDVSEPGSGFGTTTNRVTIVTPGQPPEPWPQLTKLEVAHRLLDRIVALRRG
jgi:phosphopantothenoylcysteine decarboxylase/phosphopantothenate--cysteine ligase